MTDRKGTTRKRPAIEWIFGALASMVVACIIGFLAYEAAFGDARPPDLAVTVETMETVANGTLVMVALTNRGDEAAAEIAVEALVARAGGEQSTKQIRFDHIAAHAVRRGAFVFAGSDIGPEDVRVSIHGYVEP